MANGKGTKGGGAQPGAGRPPTSYRYNPKSAQAQILAAREKARHKLAMGLERATDKLLAVMEGAGGADLATVEMIGHQLRAIENIMDRAGVPRKAELEHGLDQETRLLQFGVWRDKDGASHELPSDPAGDTRSS